MIELVFLILVITVNCEELPNRDHRIPDKCIGPYDMYFRKCCILPPFFDGRTSRDCGSSTSIFKTYDKPDVTVLKRYIGENCHYWECVLKKYKLLHTDGNLSEQKFYNYLDKWVTYNPEFKAVLMSARIYCRQLFLYSMPITTCDFYNYSQCHRNYINLDCPLFLPTKECDEWKHFFDECKEYYI